MTVDEFIDARVLPEFHEVVARIRKFMHEEAPDAKEYVGYGIPVYKGRKIFAVISPTKKDITFSFTHGSEFEDKYGLLKGVGKLAKHVKMKTVKDFNEEALQYYLKQARAIDAGR
jgi:hypothetical protein